jgi:hypothetical protein
MIGAQMILALALLASGEAPGTQDAAAVFRNARPSVVTLITGSDQTTGIGTGFVVYDGKTIATAYHVIADATEVWAVFDDGTKAQVEGFVSLDKQRDLALLRIRPTQRKPLKLNYDDPEVGARVYAIGAPKGLDFSISEGIISQIRTLEGFKQYQFTAQISPGNSGGPLLDAAGNVLAVVVWRVRDGQDLNFGTPAINIQAMERSERVNPLPISTSSENRLPYKPSVAWPRPVTGHVTQFTTTMEMAILETKMRIRFDSLETIQRVESDGVYVVKEEQKEMVMSFDGNEQKSPGSTSTTTYGPNGQVIAMLLSEADLGFNMRAANLYTIVWPEKPVAVGSKWTEQTKGDKDKGILGVDYGFEVVASENKLGVETFKITGTAKEIGGNGSCTSTSWVDAKSGRVVRIECEIKNMAMEEISFDVSVVREIKK